MVMVIPMQQPTVILTRAPIALAPAVRLVQPALVEPNQEPLLPWATPVQPGLLREEIPARVQRVVGQLTTAVVEVLSGRRPLHHLEPHASAGVHDLIGHLHRARPMPALRLASVHLSQPVEDVVEAAVRLHLGRRSRAAALRFSARTALATPEADPQRAQWRLTALELAIDPGVILRAG